MMLCWIRCACFVRLRLLGESNEDEEDEASSESRPWRLGDRRSASIALGMFAHDVGVASAVRIGGLSRGGRGHTRNMTR